jgi:DNA-directed RNA polymerase subunit N (RpoN/RPB10)
MDELTRCPECAFCIGKYVKFIDSAREAIYNNVIFGDKSKYVDYDPEKMVFDPSITPSIEHVFDAIGIKNRCCRMHLVTKKAFDKIYK